MPPENRRWNIVDGRLQKAKFRSQYQTSGSNAGVGRIIMENIIAPPALSPADMLKTLNKLNAVDPFGHFVAQLISDAQPQRCAVRDRQRLPVHLVSENGLRQSGDFQIDHFVVIAMAGSLPFLI